MVIRHYARISVIWDLSGETNSHSMSLEAKWDVSTCSTPINFLLPSYDEKHVGVASYYFQLFYRSNVLCLFKVEDGTWTRS